MIRKALGLTALLFCLVPRADAVLLGITLSGNLYSIDDTTGAETLIGNTGAIHNNLAWDAASGTLYSQSNLGLVTIDPFTAQTTLVSGPSIALSGLTYGPNGLLYGVRNALPGEGSADILVTVDPVTGLQTTIGSMGGSFDSVTSIAYFAGTLYGYDLRATEGLFTIDPTTGAASGLPGNNLIAQDIQGLTGSATGNFLWGLSRGVNGSLIQFDPVTGDQTALGVPQTRLDFRGLVDVGMFFSTIPPVVGVPEPGALLLMASGLLSFWLTRTRRRRLR